MRLLLLIHRERPRPGKSAQSCWDFGMTLGNRLETSFDPGARRRWYKVAMVRALRRVEGVSQLIY